jgi:hypothetical protein
VFPVVGVVCILDWLINCEIFTPELSEDNGQLGVAARAGIAEIISEPAKVAITISFFMCLHHPFVLILFKR